MRPSLCGFDAAENPTSGQRKARPRAHRWGLHPRLPVRPMEQSPLPQSPIALPRQPQCCCSRPQEQLRACPYSSEFSLCGLQLGSIGNDICHCASQFELSIWLFLMRACQFSRRKCLVQCSLVNLTYYCNRWLPRPVHVPSLYLFIQYAVQHCHRRNWLLNLVLTDKSEMTVDAVRFK